MSALLVDHPILEAEPRELLEPVFAAVSANGLVDDLLGRGLIAPPHFAPMLQVRPRYLRTVWTWSSIDSLKSNGKLEQPPCPNSLRRPSDTTPPVRETPLSRAAKSLIKTLRDFAKKNYGEKKMV